MFRQSRKEAATTSKPSRLPARRPITLSRGESEELLQRLGIDVEPDLAWRESLADAPYDQETAAVLASCLNPGEAVIALRRILARTQQEAREALSMLRAANAQLREALTEEQERHEVREAMLESRILAAGAAPRHVISALSGEGLPKRI